MAKSMIQRRQDAERERIEAYSVTLRRVSRAPRPTPDFERALDEARRGLAGLAIRDGALWRPKLKTRDPARLRLAAARHLYARYPVSAALEAIWLDRSGLDANEIALRMAWYVAVAGGNSLYKAGANAFLSRKEVHCFLNVTGDFSFNEAFWLAIARSYTDDPGLAARLARTKIARTPRGELVFWREVTRFFCGHPASKEEIDDLCDYIGAMHQRDAAYSLKGRTLGSLRRQMSEWHRDIAAIERIEAMRRRAAGRAPPTAGLRSQRRAWDGSLLEDWEWQPSGKEAKAHGERFFVRQLKTTEDLVAESRAMHHCVSMYAAKCIAGNASIWVLRRTALGKIERLLTIELDPQNRAVQVRGFGNRLASLDERKIIERWAKARGVMLRA
ncbi:PcfJ domain-containing protein [Mesorhizobium sp. YC-39]|uniref:PcfJ domain-containing protein n=1 Tax=unclassified Mesorhizobium TaxID=325217 RepID=UPI0021E96838|nr:MULTISPECIES: PcfJ domain-containing protein [unclassified Mesorhizobium]MCV3208973.1 PcfJ domain-containing protein [Mesorhizobium sp. YC-2]MCV3231677.1 PcfJ domain-containing protein [Mesorhizobium sp. YC-39]